MREYHVVIPNKLNLEKRLTRFQPDFDFNIDFGHLIISNVLKQTAYKLERNGNYSLEFEDIYIQQCSKTLQKLNRNYRDHMRYLCENFSGEGNILHREDYHDGKCFSYKLAPYLEKGELKLVKIKDQNLISKIRSNFSQRIPNKLKKEHNYLIGYLNPSRLKILTDEALKHVSERYKADKNYKTQLLNFVKVLNLHNEEYFFSYNPDTDGRVHTNITTFPKELRKYLRYDGMRLAEVDISSSVPSFLYFLLSNLNTNNIHLNNIITTNKSYYNHYMSVKSRVTLENKEIELFGKLILSGEFYNEFTEDFHKAHCIDSNLEPDEYYKKNVKKICGRDFDGDMRDLEKVVKKKLLSMFNAKPKKFFIEEIIFWKKFPTINYFIMSIKKQDHRFFSYLMLQIESYFMLHVIARRLNNIYKRKIPILTLHDCIITTQEKIGLVYDFMQNTFSNELGFNINMKSKTYE